MSSPDRGLKGHGVRKLCPDRLPSGVSTPYAQSPPGVRDFFPPPAGGGKPTRGRPRTGRQIHTPIRTGVRGDARPRSAAWRHPRSSSRLLALLLLGQLARRTRCSRGRPAEDPRREPGETEARPASGARRPRKRVLYPLRRPSSEHAGRSERIAGRSRGDEDGLPPSLGPAPATRSESRPCRRARALRKEERNADPTRTGRVVGQGPCERKSGSQGGRVVGRGPGATGTGPSRRAARGSTPTNGSGVGAVPAQARARAGRKRRAP